MANLECRYEMCCMRLTENTTRKNSPSAHHRTTCVGLYLRKEGMYRQSEKLIVKQQYLLHMSSQYGELRPTND